MADSFMPDVVKNLEPHARVACWLSVFGQVVAALLQL